MTPDAPDAPDLTMSATTVPTALVVDDDDDIRLLTRITLENVAGWRVLAADGGREALEQARSGRPDVILLDWMMPDMDGLATVDQLRADPATCAIPVILFTAKAWIGVTPPWQHLLAAGAVAGVIRKPYNPETLGSQISDLVGWN